MLFSITRSATFALLALFNLKFADMICGGEPKHDFIRGVFISISFLFAVFALFSALMRV